MTKRSARKVLLLLLLVLLLLARPSTQQDDAPTQVCSSADQADCLSPGQLEHLRRIRFFALKGDLPRLQMHAEGVLHHLSPSAWANFVDPSQRGGWGLLHYAAHHGHGHIVSYLLAQPGVDAALAGISGETPRQVADAAGHADVAEMLRGRGG